MTTQAKPAATTRPRRSAELDDATVVEYLSAHPDFFTEHTELVAELRLPYVRSDGHTLSLVERQVEVLRDRAREHEAKFRELIEIGRGNDALARKMHQLAVGLIHARDALARFNVVERSLREDFAADAFVLLLHDRALAAAIGEGRALRFVESGDEALRAFDTLYASGKPRCGQIRDTSRDYLFPAAASEVGSVALVPLGPGGERGLLAISSPDADRFNPTMSTDYLARIGEMIAAALT
jgi:uncharacterized protein